MKGLLVEFCPAVAGVDIPREVPLFSGNQPNSQPLLHAPVFVGECMGIRPLQVRAGSSSLLDTMVSDGVRREILSSFSLIEHLLLLDTVLGAGDAAGDKVEPCSCSHDVTDLCER